MPKITKPVKAVQDFLSLGHAVALAQLAEGKGMHVKDVLDPTSLKAAGLPEKLEHWVAKLAHDILRDRTDALLFRIRATPMAKHSLVTGTDGATMTQAREAEAKAETDKAEDRKQLARSAERRDETRTSSLNRHEKKVLLDKIKSTAKAAPPAGRAAPVIGRRQ